MPMHDPYTWTASSKTQGYGMRIKKEALNTIALLQTEAACQLAHYRQIAMPLLGGASACGLSPPQSLLHSVALLRHQY